MADSASLPASRPALHGFHFDFPSRVPADPDAPDFLKYCAFMTPDRIIARFPHRQELPETRIISVAKGIAAHLLYRKQYLRTDRPPRTLPPESAIIQYLLCLLKDHTGLARDSRAFAEILKGPACACDAERAPVLVPWLLSLSNHRDPEPEGAEIPSDPSAAAEKNRSLYESLASVRKTVRGHTLEAAVLALDSLYRLGVSPDPLLPPLLIRLASDRHPGIRCLLLLHLHTVAEWNTETAWKLLRTAMPEPIPPYWKFSEPFLLAQYPEAFQAADEFRIRAIQNRLPLDEAGWGTALGTACGRGKISGRKTVEILEQTDVASAGEPCLKVLTSASLLPRLRERALDGLKHLWAQIGSQPEILERTRLFFERLKSEPVEIQLRIAYTWVVSSRQNPEDTDWFRGWLADFSRSAPQAVRRLEEELALRRLKKQPPQKASFIKCGNSGTSKIWS